MKIKLSITGLDCPNCARSLEGEINKLDGISNAHIEFVKNSLTYESEDPDSSFEKIVALARQIEPQAQIQRTGEKHSKSFVLDLVTLISGLAIGVTIFFCPMPTWLFWTLYAVSALLMGWKTYWRALVLLFKGKINENLLITISVVGASIVSEHMEGLMVIGLYSIGKIFESLAVNHSRKSIEKLVRIQPEYARVMVDGQEVKVSPSEVEKGSIIYVHAGEKIPLDGIVVSGSAMIDNQSLTGESLPVKTDEGSEVLSGGIVLDGTLEIKTTCIQTDSTIGRIMTLVENAEENKSKTETFVSKLTRWYTLGVVLCAILVWSIVWSVTADFALAIYRGLIFLVVSCPCAFAISVPLTYFSGLGNASKHGILVKGSNFLDACAKINCVAFDKTGTLTSGQFEIKNIQTFGKFSPDEVLFIAALGEQNSLHPLAKAIVSSCDKKLKKVSSFHEIAGEGVEFDHNKKHYFVGRRDQNLSSTCVEVFENDTRIGVIELGDTIKPSAANACASLKSMGIESVILSGDNEQIVQDVADKVGADASFGRLLPEQKFDKIKSLQAEGKSVGYVGDGINDAPSLTQANVGFSMGINGAPASIEASDVVLVDDDPQKISSAIKISRHTRKVVWENISLSAVIKLVFLALGSAGITGMLLAVFADVGVTLIAILNSLRALYFKPNKTKKAH